MQISRDGDEDIPLLMWINFEFLSATGLATLTEYASFPLKNLGSASSIV
jgi:hypothetical protein